MMEHCANCKNFLPDEFFYRKNKIWKTCTPCSNKRSKIQHEVPTTLPVLKEPVELPKGPKVCKQCNKSLLEDCFVRRGRAWVTCNACSEKWCSTKDYTPKEHDDCPLCWVLKPREEFKRRNSYWALCNRCAQIKMLTRRGRANPPPGL